MSRERSEARANKIAARECLEIFADALDAWAETESVPRFGTLGAGPDSDDE
jgi:hypothetical protein